MVKGLILAVCTLRTSPLRHQDVQLNGLPDLCRVKALSRKAKRRDKTKYFKRAWGDCRFSRDVESGSLFLNLDVGTKANRFVSLLPFKGFVQLPQYNTCGHGNVERVLGTFHGDFQRLIA